MDFMRYEIEGPMLNTENAYLDKLRSTTSLVSEYLIYFVESILSNYQKGIFSGNIVFIGRSTRPLYHIANVIADDSLDDRLVLIDLPRIILEKNADEKVYKYLANNYAFQDNSVTIIDQGGRGGFVTNLERIIRTQSNGEIKVKAYQLFSLSPEHQTMFYQKPRKFIQIARALLFLGAQPHPYRLTGELVEDNDGKIYAPRNETSMIERVGAEEVERIIKEKAQNKAKIR